MKTNKRLTIALSILYAFVTIVMIAITLAMKSSIFSFGEPNIVNIDEWNSQIDSDNCVLVLSKEIDNSILGKTLVFRTSNSFVNIYINDVVVYHYGENTEICKSPGSAYNIFEVSDKFAEVGDTLSISIDTVYKYKFNTSPEIFIGSGSDIILYLIDKDVTEIVVVLLMLFASLILMAISVIYLTGGNKRLGVSIVFLSLIMLTMFIWSSFSLFITQLVIKSGTLRNMLYYISLQLIPLFIVQYINTKNCKPDKITTNLYIVFIVVLGLLQVTEIKEYAETLFLFIVVALFYIGFAIVYYNGKLSGPVTIPTRVGTIILLISIVINAIQFFVDTKSHASTMVIDLGMFTYVVIVVIASIHERIKNEISYRENQLTASLVRMDQLTGLGNRFAYNSDIKKLHLCDVAIISIDLNNLKYYNDTKGHAVGDKLLIYASYALTSVFGINAVYRIGGDEFVAIYPDARFSNFKKDYEKLNDKCLEIEKQDDCDFILEIALGIAYGNESTKSADDLLREADAAMYKNKRDIKRNSRLDKGDYFDDRLYNDSGD
jgi:diguanylate cyclase (GGDEF)-like protein